MGTEAKETSKNGNGIPKAKRVLEFEPAFKVGEVIEIAPTKLIVETDKKDLLADTTGGEGGVSTALVGDMAQNGFKSLILGVERTKGKLTVVAGRERKAAAEAAGVSAKVLILDPTLDDYDLAAAMVGENTLRTERNTMAKARYAAKLLELGVERFRPVEGEAVEVNEEGVQYNGEGWRPTNQQTKEVIQDVARKMGLTTQRIKNQLLPLVSTAPQVQKAVEKGEISEAQALVIKDKPLDKQSAAVEKIKEKLKAAKATPAPVKGNGKKKAGTRNEDGSFPKLQFKRPMLDAIVNDERTPVAVRSFLNVHLGYTPIEEAKLGWLDKVLADLMDDSDDE